MGPQYFRDGGWSPSVMGAIPCHGGGEVTLAHESVDRVVCMLRLLPFLDPVDEDFENMEGCQVAAGRIFDEADTSCKAGQGTGTNIKATRHSPSWREQQSPKVSNYQALPPRKAFNVIV